MHSKEKAAGRRPFYLPSGWRAEAARGLLRLRDYAKENGIAYYAVLFPILKPLAEWSEYDKTSREQLLAISRELSLGLVDLKPVAERLIERGVDPKEGHGDIWHPNQIFADEAAQYILEKIPALRLSLTGVQAGKVAD